MKRWLEYLVGFGSVILIAAGALTLALGGILRLRWHAGLAIFVGMLLIAGLFELPCFCNTADTSATAADEMMC
jgi:hypothetical protein